MTLIIYYDSDPEGVLQESQTLNVSTGSNVSDRVREERETTTSPRGDDGEESDWDSWSDEEDEEVKRGQPGTFLLDFIEIINLQLQFYKKI